jgi:hypothetical protein
MASFDSFFLRPTAKATSMKSAAARDMKRKWGLPRLLTLAQTVIASRNSREFTDWPSLPTIRVL